MVTAGKEGQAAFGEDRPESGPAAATAAAWLQSCPTLCDPRPWDSPGKSTGVGCHCLLRGPVLQDRN